MITKEWAVKDLYIIGSILVSFGATYMAFSKDLEKVEGLPDKVVQNEKDIIILKSNQEHIIEGVEEIKVVQKEEINKNEKRAVENQKFQIKIIQMVERMGDNLEKAVNK